VRDEKGRFLPGPVPDRHVFTLGECRRGFATVTLCRKGADGRTEYLIKLPSRVRAWLRSKIRRHYQNRPRPGAAG
jgi:hypothetical protein